MEENKNTNATQNENTQDQAKAQTAGQQNQQAEAKTAPNAASTNTDQAKAQAEANAKAAAGNAAANANTAANDAAANAKAAANDAAANAKAAASSAMDAAKGFTGSFDFDSFKVQKEKAQALENTAKQLQELRDQLVKDEAEHQRRVLIEKNYDVIVEEQTTLRTKSYEGIAVAESEIKKLEAALAQPLKEYNALREKQEDVIRPYRTAMQNADADVSQAEANIRSINSQIESATEELARANSEYEAAVKQQAQANNELKSLEDQVNSMRRNGDIPDQAHLQTLLSQCNAAINMASNRASAAQGSINAAQMNINNIRQQLSRAQNELSNAQAKFKNAKTQYDQMDQRHKKEAEPLSSVVFPLQNAINDNNERIANLNKTIIACDNALRDAKDVHEHPEEIKRLANAIARGRQSIAAAEALHERLTAEHEQAKQAANKVKMLIGGVVGVVVIIFLLITFLPSMF